MFYSWYLMVFCLFFSMPPVKGSGEENFRLFIGKFHLNGQSVINSDQKPRNYNRKIPFKHRYTWWKTCKGKETDI